MKSSVRFFSIVVHPDVSLKDMCSRRKKYTVSYKKLREMLHFQDFLMDGSVAAFKMSIKYIRTTFPELGRLKNLSLILCLKLLRFLADFRSECRLFQNIGPN